MALFVTLDIKAGILCAIVLTTFCGISGNGLGADSVRRARARSHTAGCNRKTMAAD